MQSRDAYAEAIFEIARAEDRLGRLEDELFQVARGLEGSTELSEALSDRRIPVDRRRAIVEDLVAGKASPVTLAIVDLLVSTERIRDLPNIVDRFVEMAAAHRQRAVAEIRSAIPLDGATVGRLEAVLGRVTSKDVEARVIVDEGLIGGIVAKVGDVVIDGSVRSRLDELRRVVR
ncbi:MAG TPA: ATP synthase F1 subunit delta [Acidimicrobiia bacterium]